MQARVPSRATPTATPSCSQFHLRKEVKRKRNKCLSRHLESKWGTLMQILHPQDSVHLRERSAHPDESNMIIVRSSYKLVLCDCRGLGTSLRRFSKSFSCVRAQNKGTMCSASQTKSGTRRWLSGVCFNSRFPFGFPLSHFVQPATPASKFRFFASQNGN